MLFKNLRTPIQTFRVTFPTVFTLYTCAHKLMVRCYYSRKEKKYGFKISCDQGSGYQPVTTSPPFSESCEDLLVKLEGFLRSVCKYGDELPHITSVLKPADVALVETLSDMDPDRFLTLARVRCIIKDLQQGTVVCADDVPLEAHA